MTSGMQQNVFTVNLMKKSFSQIMILENQTRQAAEIKLENQRMKQEVLVLQLLELIFHSKKRDRLPIIM